MIGMVCGLGLIGQPGLSENVPTTSRIFVRSHDFENYRRIVVTAAALDSDRVVIPKVEYNRHDGRFRILFQPTDARRYFGKPMLRDDGINPYWVNIRFPDSLSILLDGYVNQLETVVTYYSFSRARYIFDFYRKAPEEDAFLSQAQLDRMLRDDQRLFRNPPKALDFAQSRPDDRFLFGLNLERFKMAMMIAGAAVIFFCLLVIFVLIPRTLARRRLRKQGKHSSKEAAESPRLSAPTTEPPAVAADESENQIRQLMTEKGISYDEAVLLISMQNRKINVQA